MMKKYLEGTYVGPGDPADGSAKPTDGRSLAYGDGVLRAVIEAAEFI